MKKLVQFLSSLFVLCCLFYVVSTPAKAVSLQPYFFAPNAPGNSMSSGEFFKTIDEGNGCYKIQKSRDAQYYERYCVKEDGKIYHKEDTTWATADGNVTCNDTGNEAKLSYAGGETPWANGNMSTGETFTSSGTVIGIDKVTGKECATPFTGPFTRTVKMITQGCVVFPDQNGNYTKGSNDAVGLEIESGPGAGEQFFYGNGQGWIGFNRGGDETGAYAENLGNVTNPASCYQVKFSSIGKNCPVGYTCPKMSTNPTLGEKINVVKNVARNAVESALKGLTGPKTAELETPDLSQENNYYSTKDFFQRSLTDTAQKDLAFNPQAMQGKLAHPGCENLIVDNNAVDKAKTEDQTTTFDTTGDYNNLLLTNEYWRCTLVNGFNCKLKFKNTQPDYSDIQVPDNSGNCVNSSGVSMDNTAINNSAPPQLSFVDNILDTVRRLFQCIINPTSKDCGTVKVEYNLQQLKYIPGETTFDDQTVNKDGFLNWFKVDIPESKTMSYEKAPAERDEDEKSQYKVVDDDRTVGTTFQGEADFQKETVNMVKSLYVEDLAKDINSLGPSTAEVVVSPGTIPTEITDLLKIPYRDASITIDSATKARVIAKVKQFNPQSNIDKYWDVVTSRATSSGINPAFALAVWIEESGAGQYPNNFSCAVDHNFSNGFNNSLDCFIKTTLNSPPTPDFAGWAQNYCGTPAPGQPICGVNAAGENNSKFLTNLNWWYNQFTQQKIQGVE